jgi:preprotein translocase subunit SecE
MGVETKKSMANSIAAVGEGFGDRIKAWPERTRSFYNDVRTEMKKVTAPSWKEVQSTTVVVIIAVFLFAGFFWIVDFILSHSLDMLFRYLVHHGI